MNDEAAQDGARLEQDANNLLVAFWGSPHQGGHAFDICLIWVHLCLEQDKSAPLVAVMGSFHQGGPTCVVLSAQDGARLEQDASDLLVAILGCKHQRRMPAWYSMGCSCSML